MIGLTHWHLVLLLGIPLIIVVFIGLALAWIIRAASAGRRVSNSTVHGELVRIDERLTSIEKVLRDIE